MTMRRSIARGAALLVAAGCGHEPVPVKLGVEPGATVTRIWLEPAPGWKINALLPPAFEPVGGPPVRFTAPGLTADSAYYLEPPVALIPGGGLPRGILRVSLCAAGEQVCRPYVRMFGS
jgi:hypothetical protein